MSMVYPMFALVLLTFAVAIGLGVSRVTALKRGQTRMRYYKLMQGDGPPEQAVKFSRNFTNLFEVPVLFYALGALVVGMGFNGPVLMILAWIYVALRVVHSIIHVTYNDPTHRFVAFVLSTVLLLAMWCYLIFAITL